MERMLFLISYEMSRKAEREKTLFSFSRCRFCYTGDGNADDGGRPPFIDAVIEKEERRLET